MQIAVIVGSLRKASLNRHLAERLEALLPSGVTFKYVSVDLPLFNQDIENNAPQSVKDAKAIVDESDGVLIVTPEYNRSLSGVLKNAIDWLSRPYGQNSWKGKPVASAGVSGGSLGTAPAQQHLRSIMVYLEAIIMGQPEMYVVNGHSFHEDGSLTEKSQVYFQSFIDAFIAHIKKNQ